MIAIVSPERINAHILLKAVLGDGSRYFGMESVN
jgi:hypothetical protein